MYLIKKDTEARLRGKVRKAVDRDSNNLRNDNTRHGKIFGLSLASAEMLGNTAEDVG